LDGSEEKVGAREEYKESREDVDGLRRD